MYQLHGNLTTFKGIRDQAERHTDGKANRIHKHFQLCWKKLKILVSTSLKLVLVYNSLEFKAQNIDYIKLCFYRTEKKRAKQTELQKGLFRTRGRSGERLNKLHSDFDSFGACNEKITGK